MSDVWSSRTKTLVGSTLVAESDITPYPDIDIETGEVTTSATELMVSDAGSTTDDISAMFKWKHGDELYGTHAKSHPGMLEYIKDINKDYGREKDYNKNVIFIDTLMPIGDQLKKVR